MASCLILEAIAIERFIAVVCPLRHHTLSTTRNACVIILGCWGYAMVIGGMPLAGWNVVDVTDAPVNYVNVSSVAETTSNAAVNLSTAKSSSAFSDCRFDTVVGGSYVAFLYPGHFVPLCVVMLIVYTQVYLHSRGRRSRPPHRSSYRLNVYNNVRRLSVAVSSGANNGNPESASASGSKRTTARAHENWRAMRILVVLVGYFLVSWLPVVVWYCTLFRGFWLESARDVDPLLPVWFYNISITLAYGNSAVNPFLYGFGNRSIRRCVLLTVHELRRQRTTGGARPDQRAVIAD